MDQDVRQNIGVLCVAALVVVAGLVVRTLSEPFGGTLMLMGALVAVAGLGGIAHSLIRTR